MSDCHLPTFFANCQSEPRTPNKALAYHLISFDLTSKQNLSRHIYLAKRSKQFWVVSPHKKQTGPPFLNTHPCSSEWHIYTPRLCSILGRNLPIFLTHPSVGLICV